MSDKLNEWNAVAAKSFDSAMLDNLVGQLFTVGQKYDELEAAKKQVGSEYDELQSQILKILSDAKKSNYSVDGVGQVYTNNKYVVRVPEGLENLRQFKAWCLQKYGEDYVDATFKMHSQALTAFYNKEKENSPDAGFSIPGVEAPTLVQTLKFKKESK